MCQNLKDNFAYKLNNIRVIWNKAPCSTNTYIFEHIKVNMQNKSIYKTIFE